MSVYAPSGSGNVHTDKVMSGGGKRVATTKATKPKAKKPAAKPAAKKPAVKGKFPVAAVAITPGKPMVTKPVVKKAAAKRTGRRGGK